MNCKAQMKIQQMAFMIIALFFFFVLVGLFFLSFQYRNLEGSYEDLQIEQAISSIEVISDMPEFNCVSGDSNCIDEDKLVVMKRFGALYKEFLPVASIEMYKIYPAFEEVRECPGVDCNHYTIFNSEKNVKKYSRFVSICKDVESNYEKCEIGKLVVGVENE